MKEGIIISGVGGQGVLTLARLIGEIALMKGFNVRVAEVHGLAQRGGSLMASVKLGRSILAPTVGLGTADKLLGLELIEGIRYLNYLKEGGIAIINDYLIEPPLSKPLDRRKLIDQLRGLPFKIYLVNAYSIARSLGDVRVVNMVMLGAYSKLKDTWFNWSEAVKVLKRVFKGKLLELNIKAFRMGKEAPLKSLS